MNAAIERLRVLAMQTPLARLSGLLGKTDTASISGRHEGRVSELREPLLDGNGRIDAEELNAWLQAKAEEYLGKGEGFHKFMNAGRVDGYWTVAGMLQAQLRARAEQSEAAQ